ncbi:MAG: hypothetical protein ISS15_06930 [Alphaproteobacteria bacterium]|nr:hypothetical protein [Alphaproteobacteria bacterium]MBL7097372.1 hypothetical protein [Alphaproteobacteria bacterium]
MLNLLGNIFGMLRRSLPFSWRGSLPFVGRVILCALVVAADIHLAGGLLHEIFGALAALGGTSFLGCLVAAFSVFAQLVHAPHLAGLCRDAWRDLLRALRDFQGRLQR